jgi:hypothetical protein
LLKKVRDYWPDDDAFESENIGNYTCHPHRLTNDNPERFRFWQNFAANIAPVIAASYLGQFAEWIVARYGPQFCNIPIGYFGLMQAEPNYAGIAGHTHHRHDPLWLATALIYVDADPAGHQGTTINFVPVPEGADRLDYLARFSAENIRATHGDKLIEAQRSSYRANRMTAFLDSPISYHSVLPAQNDATGRRRVLRFHIGASWDLMPSVYGVSYWDYRNRRNEPTTDEIVLSWLRRDIANVFGTTRYMSFRQRKRWARGLSFDFA